jgi:hypothetical protein
VWEPSGFILSPGRANGNWGPKSRLDDCSACHPLSRWYLARLILRSWRWRRCVPPERRLALNGLHGVTSQKIVFFNTTAVRASNPTCSRVAFHFIVHVAWHIIVISKNIDPEIMFWSPLPKEMYIRVRIVVKILTSKFWWVYTFSAPWIRESIFLNFVCLYAFVPRKLTIG